MGTRACRRPGKGAGRVLGGGGDSHESCAADCRPRPPRRTRAGGGRRLPHRRRAGKGEVAPGRVRPLGNSLAASPRGAGARRDQLRARADTGHGLDPCPRRPGPRVLRRPRRPRHDAPGPRGGAGAGAVHGRRRDRGRRRHRGASHASSAGVEGDGRRPAPRRPHRPLPRRTRRRRPAAPRSHRRPRGRPVGLARTAVLARDRLLGRGSGR